MINSNLIDYCYTSSWIQTKLYHTNNANNNHKIVEGPSWKFFYRYFVVIRTTLKSDGRICSLQTCIKTRSVTRYETVPPGREWANQGGGAFSL